MGRYTPTHRITARIVGLVLLLFAALGAWGSSLVGPPSLDPIFTTSDRLNLLTAVVALGALAVVRLGDDEHARVYNLALGTGLVVLSALALLAPDLVMDALGFNRADAVLDGLIGLVLLAVGAWAEPMPPHPTA